MKTKTYEITITGNKQHIWDIMFGKETYPQWIKGFSENSEMIGEWKEGADVDFMDKNMGGTRATIEALDIPNRIFMKHIAVLSKEGEVQPDEMEGWVGTTEEYVLTQEGESVKVTINVECNEHYFEMLDAGFDKSLKLLKELCER